MILFFLHIPKTAGTSILVTAQSTLSRRNTVLIHNPDADRLAARLRRLSNYREIFFVQGHLTPIPEFFSIPMKRVTVLRQPLNRLLSHFCYSFDRRYYDRRQLEFFQARKNYDRARFDGEDLVAWVEKFKMDDFQVRFLSGDYDRPLTSESEARALETLRKLDFVGTMENVGELFAVLSALTASEFNVCRMPHKNKSNKNHLNVCRSDLEFLDANFCRRDNRLAQDIGEHKHAMYDKCLNSVLEKVGLDAPRNVNRVLGSLFSNGTVHEMLFRLKRKSVGLTAYGLDIVQNIVSWK